MLASHQTTGPECFQSSISRPNVLLQFRGSDPLMSMKGRFLYLDIFASLLFTSIPLRLAYTFHTQGLLWSLPRLVGLRK